MDQDNFIRGQLDMIQQVWILLDRAEAEESKASGNNLTGV